jgi:hypothetical protein
MSRTVAFTMLDGVTTGIATGDGSVFPVDFPYLGAAVQAEISGAPVACVINIMGKIDGSTYDTIAVLDIAQGYVSGEVSPLTFPVPLRTIKANIGALSAGATVKLYFHAVEG